MGCACDIGEGCGNKDSVATATEHSHVEGFVDRTPYARHGPATPLCPLGTMFDAGWEPTSMGFLTGQAADFSVVDEVQVPTKKGEYVLSWRWDCEQTDQVWNSCADIVITNDPVPAPTPTPPTPPSPSPSPSPGGKDYVCYLGQCYKKPGFGKMTKETCSTTCGEPSPSPSPSKGDYLCFDSMCYEKPGYGTMDQATCEKVCSSKSFINDVVV